MSDSPIPTLVRRGGGQPTIPEGATITAATMTVHMVSGTSTANADLVSMMNGAHIVMGYASRATICDAMAEDFAEYLRNGMPIYDAYFEAGHTGEASVDTARHYQRILYIPQARYETIYSPSAWYDYDISAVKISTNCIQDGY